LFDKTKYNELKYMHFISIFVKTILIVIKSVEKKTRKKWKNKYHILYIFIRYIIIIEYYFKYFSHCFNIIKNKKNKKL